MTTIRDNPYRSGNDRPMPGDDHRGFWWLAPSGDAHSRVFDYVGSVENVQSDLFERFLKLGCLYDKYETMGQGAAAENLPGRKAYVVENVVSSNVDTVTAQIAKAKPRAVFTPDDGDWSTQRQAKAMEFYSAGLVKHAKVHSKGPRVFKDCSTFGTGVAKVFQDGASICMERVLVDEMVVDNNECRTGSPLQLHQRKLVDRGVLKVRYPEYADQISRAHKDDGGTGRWAGYMPLETNQLVVIESWRLPIGDRPEDDEETESYIPGRHTICIEGATLLDEPYHRKRFPFAVIRWNERITGWYGKGLVEDIAGHQAVLNKTNAQIDSNFDLHALPTTYIQMGDLGMVRQMAVTQIGRVIPFKVTPPVTVTPQPVPPQLLQRQEAVKQSAYDFSGVSRMQAHAKKEAGIESAVALREMHDQTTERFAIQEQAYEQWFLDVVSLMLETAKEMAEAHKRDSECPDAPVISHKTRHLNRRIRWQDVDMGDVEVQMQAASSLARTLAGRQQTVVEWAQAGVVTQDEARRLMQHPDLERELSLYNAAREDIERCIEAILEGEVLVPEPYQNLEMGLRLFQRAYLLALSDGAPEEICLSLQDWMTQAAHVLNPPAAEQPPMPMGQPMGAPMPGPMPGGPMPPEMAPPPQAAFASQAMALRPSSQAA